MEIIGYNKFYKHGMILLTMVGIIIYAILFGITYLFFQPKNSHAHTCADFTSYPDIMKDYLAGNQGLDGDGDGIPCENRK